MAELRARLDALQTFLDQVVVKHNGGQLAAETVADVKLLASELENHVLDECVQLHSGAGYMEEYHVCRMVYRRARLANLCWYLGNHDGNHRPLTGPG